MATPMEVGCGGTPGKQAGQKANRSNPPPFEPVESLSHSKGGIRYLKFQQPIVVGSLAVLES
jgi:hypothetical protein